MNIPSETEVKLYEEVIRMLTDATKVALSMGITRAELQAIQWRLAIEVQEGMSKDLLDGIRARRKASEDAEEAALKAKKN